MAADDRTDAELRRQLATLIYSQVRPAGPADAVAAVGWWNLVARLGFRVPLVVIHDLGLLLSGGRFARGREVRREGMLGGVGAPIMGRYQAFLSRLAEAEAIDELGAAPLSDDTLAVILARLVGDLYLRWPGRPRLELVGDLPSTSPSFGEAASDLARANDPAWALTFVQRLVDQERAVLARLEQVEAGTVRLLGLFAMAGGGAELGDLADLYRFVGTAGAADVVDFSLQLMPSLLETKRRPAAQRFSIDGYASVERRGHVDTLLPVELAHDDEVFTQKALSDDLLYYGHERQHETPNRLHYILVDGSASMRGAREVFARGLALALAKKLSLAGGRGAEVWLRFFDSRLHPRLDVLRMARRDLPRLLGFRSERGRNYARVFSDLTAEVGRLVREEGRDVAVTFVTHGACHIPVATVQALADKAHLYGIFVLPSKPLDLEYLPLLHRHQVVTAASLAGTGGRRRRALEIVDDAASA
jgi:hypothetical protein